MHIFLVMAYKLEIHGFCAAIRAGRPLLCGPERAFASDAACLTANESADKKQRLTIPCISV